MDTFTLFISGNRHHIFSRCCYSESSIHFQWEVININLAKPYIDAEELSHWGDEEMWDLGSK